MDPIQQAVEECANKIWVSLGQEAPRFLAVHFLCGESKKPGFIRKSAVRLGDAFVKSLDLQSTVGWDQLAEDERNGRHRSVLRRHVRMFEREETLLTLSLDAMARLNPTTGFWVRVGARVPDPLPEGWSGHSLDWPDGIAQVLVPLEDAKAHLRQAYEDNRGTLDAGSLFEMHRAEAFGRWLGHPQAPDKLELWNKIKPLQSSLVYLAVASESEPGISGDILLFKLDAIVNGNTAVPALQPLAVVVLSPPLSSAGGADGLSRLVKDAFAHDRVRDHLRGHKELEEMRQALEKQLELNPAIDDKLRRERDILPVPGHKDRFLLLTLWLALLTKNLARSIHEGTPLEFWFVAGDLSEFEDDPDILFDKRFGSNDECVRFSPPGDLSKLEPHAKAAVTLLEKEHFPWFKDGRHALFFDLTDAKMRAVGLCGIRRSTWSHLLGEIYKSEGEQQQAVSGVSIPTCLIGFVSTRHGGAGIALCCPKADTGKKLKLLLRFREGSWQSTQDVRQVELVKLLSQVAGTAGSDEKKALAELCVLIADNPHAGGTVVLVNDVKQFESFIQMGKPWDLGELSLSEKSQLMSHDGATLVCLDANSHRFDYRYILTPDGLLPAIRKGIVGLSTGFDNGSPLAGVGTRRWSAALAAFKEGVETVIVISQDGDITCWRCQDKANWSDADILRLPPGGVPQPAKVGAYLPPQ
jgi:hypothetical protein